MNPITKALMDIKISIDRKVLEIAFKEETHSYYDNVSLDERITARVIRPIVIMDCNLIGGIPAYIPVSACNIQTASPYEYVLDVPKKLTNGKTIMFVYNIVLNQSYGSTTVSGSLGAFHGGSSLLENSLVKMHGNMSGVTTLQTSRLEIIGDNLIIVRSPEAYLTDGILKCAVGHDANMSNLKPGTYIPFANACVLATKSYIHNQLKIRIDQGYIESGHELSVITDIVDSYSDARVMYQEYLKEVLMVSLFMNSDANMSSYVSSMFGNG